MIKKKKIKKIPRLKPFGTLRPRPSFPSRQPLTPPDVRSAARRQRGSEAHSIPPGWAKGYGVGQVLPYKIYNKLLLTIKSWKRNIVIGGNRASVNVVGVARIDARRIHRPLQTLLPTVKLHNTFSARRTGFYRSVVLKKRNVRL